jgi:hypothetical protein
MNDFSRVDSTHRAPPPQIAQTEAPVNYKTKPAAGSFADYPAPRAIEKNGASTPYAAPKRVAEGDSPPKPPAGGSTSPTAAEDAAEGDTADTAIKRYRNAREKAIEWRPANSRATPKERNAAKRAGEELNNAAFAAWHEAVRAKAVHVQALERTKNMKLEAAFKALLELNNAPKGPIKAEKQKAVDVAFEALIRAKTNLADAEKTYYALTAEYEQSTK